MEQSLSIKGLGLITISIAIVSVLIVGTLAYSGYQEVNYLTQTLSQQAGGFMNITPFPVTGLNLENRGLYPITFALRGDLMVDGDSIGSSSVGPLTIPPGSQRIIDLNLTPQMSQVLIEPLIRKLLFNGTSASLRLNISGGIEPFVTATASESTNMTIGAALDGLNLKAGHLTLHNATFVQLPVNVSFMNRSPIPLDATLSAQVISTPVDPTIGNYGSGSMMISSSPGQLFEGSLNILLPTEAVGQGNYVLELNLTSRSFTYSWSVTVKGGT